jgi:hypothetical protein
MTFTKARRLLASDGFTVLGKHTRLGQIVLRTNPQAGELPAGSVIIVVYGTGALLLPARPRQARRRPVIHRPIPLVEQPFSIALAIMIRIPKLPKREVCHGGCGAVPAILRKELRIPLKF